MADIDIDPFGEHESRTDEPTDERIPLDPVTPGRSTWEPDRAQVNYCRGTGLFWQKSKVKFKN